VVKIDILYFKLYYFQGLHELIEVAMLSSTTVTKRSLTNIFTLNKVAFILQSCNHTGNFFIYIIANSTLRRNFLQRFTKVKKAVCVNAETSSV